MAASNDGKNVFSSALDVRKVLPFAFLLLALLVTLTVNSISRYNDLLTSQKWVEHTHLVLHEIDEAGNSLQEAREAALHYVLTPEQEDLINFDEAVKKTWVRLERITDLTADEKGFPERMAQLRGLIEKEFRQSEDNMRTTHTLLIFHSPAADANRDRVHAAMQKLKVDEEEILRVRSEAARARAHDLARSGFLVVGGFSVLVAVLILLVILESRKLFVEQNAPNTQSRLKESLQQLQPESAAAATAGDEKSNPS